MWCQELQSDSPDCLSAKAMHSCQSLWLISQVKVKPKIPERVFFFFFSVYLLIRLSISQALRLAYSQPSPQTACNRPSGSHFGSKLAWRDLRLAKGSVFQSISQGWLENSHFSVFLWLTAHLSRLINVLQPVRTLRVRSRTSEPKWRHESESGNRCFE